MNRWLRVIALLMLFTASSALADAPIRFATVDVYIDAAEPMAAWQLEFFAVSGRMQVVGVENGDSTAFDGAPYYDREAVENGRADRIVVADYSLDDERRAAAWPGTRHDAAPDAVRRRSTGVQYAADRRIDLPGKENKRRDQFRDR